MRDRTRDVILRGMMKIETDIARKNSRSSVFSIVAFEFFQHSIESSICGMHNEWKQSSPSFFLSFFLPSKRRRRDSVPLSLSPSLSLSLPLGYLISPNFFCPFNFGRRELTSVQKVSVRHTRKRTHICTHDGGRSVDAAVAT